MPGKGWVSAWASALWGLDWAGVGLDALKVAAKVLAVLLAARLAIILANRLIDRFVARDHHRRLFDDRRLHTLAGVAKSAVRYTLDFVAVVTAFSFLGVDTSSLLLGAGVAGLAVGFGAQNLVRDVLSGFFLLFEDQYGVGDYVNLGGVEGIVEDVGLRTTKLRSFGGELEIIPNGSVQRVTNYSRGPLRVLFEVNIPYEEDTARAMNLIQQALDRVRAAKDAIVEGPRVLGVSSLGPTGVRVMVWARAKALEHWDVEREMKLAIKEALGQAGIDISRYRALFTPARSPRVGAGDNAAGDGTGPSRTAGPPGEE